MKKWLIVSFLAVLLVVVAGCSGGGKAKGTDGKVDLTFSIWDSNQKAGMEDMAKAFMKENPSTKVTVEVTPWDQYWTKLQAAATGGNMADVFWMHPDQVYSFAEGNALLDMTDKIKASSVELSNYPEFVTRVFDIDGKQLALPKDYSTVALWYNKDLFDAAGISYPDENWTWDDWMSASEKLTDKDKSIYGMLAPADGQNFWYNLLWQNGSDIVSKDGKKSLLDSEKSIEAIKYGVSFIEKGYSPSTSDFANTTPDQYFESGKAAMITAGSWMSNEYLSIDGLNVDLAPMPKKEQQGSVASGMGYGIAANTKNPDEAWKFVEFMGSKEGNLIQAKSGAAIPAYKDTQAPWVEKFPTIDAQVFVDAETYGHSSMYVESRVDWVTIEQEWMMDIFSGKVAVEKGAKEMTKEIQAAMDQK
ncbi:ABC transporter substrate-binding protein [Carnobacterium gallinarum]|uniref:ABC transporter substrate-binding protein n=1 Tax=Carnobacterium gallinarum TaxID=2749 RepID=UPI0005579174|nr:sugar ABC transporter substrate-binding protein [Carnobacterium gallinarum]